MDRTDLYSVEIPDEAFGTPCGGNIGGSLESCVDSAEIPGQPGAVALRDSKLGDGSPELRFSAAEMGAFVESYAATYGTTI